MFRVLSPEIWNLKFAHGIAAPIESTGVRFA